MVETTPTDNKNKKGPLPVLVKNQQIYSDVLDGTISEEDEDVFSDSSTNAPTRNSTSKASKRASKSGNQTAMSAFPSTPRKTLATFSCHDISPDDDGTSGKQNRTSKNRWSIDETPEDKIRQEFRQMLLDENDKRLETAQKHTNVFLEKVAYDMQRERREREERERQIARQRAEDLEAERMNSKEAKLERMREDIKKKKRERMQKGHEAEGNKDMLERNEGETDEEYTERMEKWREEMKRIRYLRRQSQGLTDVVTLVTAGMAANKIWREGLAHDLI
ncbi:uncharacterized protein [Amphiura filiformis]|uniref:uncharacterized protein n=1 Tax=Amphiura filiformis TaxID=82378 RepID=UPI003B219899